MKKFNKQVEERVCGIATMQLFAIIITDMIQLPNIEFIFVNMMYLPALLHIGFYERISKGKNTMLKLIVFHVIVYLCTGISGIFLYSNDSLFEIFINVMSCTVSNGIFLFLLVAMNLLMLDFIESRFSKKLEI